MSIQGLDPFKKQKLQFVKAKFQSKQNVPKLFTSTGLLPYMTMRKTITRYQIVHL